MHVTDANNIREILRLFAETLMECKDVLTEIDSRTGDGDLGISMYKGGSALLAVLDSADEKSIGQWLSDCGMAFNRAAPSTMGTLIGMSLMTLGKEWKDWQSLGVADAVRAPEIIAGTISCFGKAREGDKTILDALCPFARTLSARFEATGDFTMSYAEALDAARAGMERTKGMKAAVGRARWLGDSASSSVDGGAVLCVMVLEKFRSVIVPSGAS